MLRILLLVVMMAGFALAFIARSPGLLGLGLLLGMFGLGGFVLGLAAARVAGSARPETAMASVEDLVALRKRPAPAYPPRTTGATGPDATDRAS